ncbi:MAG TPA: tetratricopeptide repeat protein [Steroidobacteraceae bacterium]|nr:tetratricopeptide repeat protein [Steroidobacteraceae bacterium]
MEDYLSEREKWEQVVAWLKENGPWIVAGVAIAALGVSGWRWWQARVNQADLDAAARYQQVLTAFDRGDRAHGLSLLDDLQHAHPRSPYVDQANLAAARLFVDSNELDQAGQRLSAVMGHSSDRELAAIARVRLARVQIAEGKPDAALATLGTPEATAFAARYHEVRGDAYYAKGDKAAALSEYQAARAAAGTAVAQNDALALKIQDLMSEPTAAHRPAASGQAR